MPRLLVITAILLAANAALATTIHVPADEPTIQAGIDAASEGDTVLVAPGTYVGDGNRDVMFYGKAILLESIAGPEVTIVDCQGSPESPHRGFHFVNGEGPSSVLRGFTIVNGHAPYDYPVADWSAGGGVACYDGSSPSIENCTFLNNYAQRYGGGLCAHESSPEISHCLFDGSSCDYAGGAVFYAYSAFALLDSCVFQNNTCENTAALFLHFTDARIENCLFGSNWAEQQSGALYTYASVSELINCAFDLNDSPAGAGAVYIQGSESASMIHNCTFVNNSGRDAGAILIVSSQMDISNSIFSYNLGSAPLVGSSYSIACTDIFGNEEGDWTENIVGQLPVNGNLNLDPEFCSLPDRELNLKNSSPCAPGNNECHELIGAYPIGCAGIEVLSFLGEAGLNNLVQHTPTVQWTYYEPEGFSQTAFQVEVGLDLDWSIAEMWSPGVIQSADQLVEYTGHSLLDGVTYFVRLQAYDDLYSTGWYQTSFRMNSLPTVPDESSPTNGSVVGQQPTLSVVNSTDPEGDPLQYEFEVYSEPEMTTLVASSGLVDEQSEFTEWPVDVILLEDQHYFWRARAWDGYEYSDWHSPLLIWVDASPSTPSTPTVVTPVGEGLILFDMLPTFEWTESIDPDPTGEVNYRLDIALDDGFTFVSSYPDLSTVSHQLTDSLEFGEEYWWRVAAIDNTELQSVSEPSQFWTWMLGDANHNHDVSIGDISLLIDHLFIDKTPIIPLKVGDMNATCDITIGDISALVDHLFQTQGPLEVGCE